MSDELKRAWDEADRLRGVIRDVCSAMDPSGHVAAENVEQKAEEMRKEIERLTDPVDGLEAKLVERTAEREEARDWVRRLTREQRVLTCAFCGAEYPPGTPESNDAALTAHVRVCPKHPMRETEAEVSRLTDALDTAETCRESLRKGLEQASEQIAEMTAEAKVATAEIEQLRDTVHNYKALLAAAESAGREVCDERDEARAEVSRLKADLLLLGALKSEEVAPVIERFREAFGADVPQAPSGQRALTRDRAREIGLRAMSPAPGRIPEGIVDQVEDAILRAAAGEFGAPCEPAKGDGVGCSREPGCEVEP